MLIQVRYDEISLKGGRRSYYEAMLVQNLANQTGLPKSRVRSGRGRIRIELDEGDEPEAVWGGIQRTFGVVDAAEVREVQSTSARPRGSGSSWRGRPTRSEPGASRSRRNVATRHTQ